MKDQKPKGHLTTRWKVSKRGNVAHLRLGETAQTVCGETIVQGGGPVAATAAMPACTRCAQAVKSHKAGLGARPKAVSPQTLDNPPGSVTT